MAKNGCKQRKEWGDVPVRITLPAVDYEELQMIYGRLPNKELARLVRRLCNHHRQARGAAPLGDLTKWGETPEDLEYYQ